MPVLYVKGSIVPTCKKKKKILKEFAKNLQRWKMLKSTYESVQ